MITAGNASDRIAIVGMAGRFPGANDVEEFWRNLRDGVESITFFTDEELREAGVDESLLADPNYVKAYGLLDDVELFDAGFFGLRGQEAEIMDPQHRLFLETAWQAMEHAGYDAEQYDGAVGVFAGAGVDSYMLFNLMSNRDVLRSVGILQTSIRNRSDHLATQVSYRMNLKGPALTVQTACSTSLVAVHLACQNLLSGECDLAMAGGVSVGVPQKSGYLRQEGGILSPDGHCRAFDAESGGTIGGSGVGIVVLKRLEDAMEDGDTIHGVILGSAINNDGSEKVGYTAPGVDGQTEVIAEAHAIAGVDSQSISYVEAHGTGTTLGDPIEVDALTRAFRSPSTEQKHCGLGAVKSNVGHLDTAAGVTGLIKTTMALKHKQLPPSLHYTAPNPRIDFENSPFYVNAKLKDWEPPAGSPRRAGVSSFGLGGTNAHLVMEEAPALPASEPGRPWHLLMLSAKSSTALEEATANLAEYLRQRPDTNLADVAYTLQVGRRRFGHQRAIVCQDGDAASALNDLSPKNVHTGVKDPKKRSVVFMFTGQGAQYARMGLDVYRAEPTFRELVDDCCQRLQAHLGFDLREVMYPDDANVAEAEEKLQHTSVTQPALFVLEYCLARLWMSWGIQPVAMIGHSIGEYAAACIAGVLTLDDALALVAKRGKLMQQCPAGSMLAVTMAAEELAPLLGSELCLATINGPQQSVVAGPFDAISDLEARLTTDGIGCRRLKTSHAFHSAMMDSILDEFTDNVRRISLQPPKIPFISNVSGTWITTEEATSPEYWSQHLRQTVRFNDGLTELVKDPDWILLEVGPGWTLMSMARWHPKRAPGQLVLTSLRNKAENEESDYFRLLSTLGNLSLGGADFDSKAFFQHESRRRIPLPTYPFQRQRYWIEPKHDGLADLGLSLDRQANIENWFFVPTWHRTAQKQDTAAETSTQRWLIFLDETGFCQGLAGRLSELGADVATVAAGKRFEALGNHAYKLDPECHDDYAALADELRSADFHPTHVIHAWELTPLDAPRTKQCIPLGFASLLHLAKALGSTIDDEKIHVAVLSNGMQEVVGGELLYPEKATLLGACRAIPKEFANLTCQSIDIEVGHRSGSNGNHSSVDQDVLIADISVHGDPIVAYRGRHRWVQTYDNSPLPDPHDQLPALRPGGTYLITGGLGGIGLEIAKYLAQHFQPHLILTGRSAFPAAEQWDQYLATHGEQDRTSRKVAALQELQRLGATVQVAQLDVADAPGMRGLFEEAARGNHAIQGVVHAAGIAGGGMIQLKTADSLAESFRAKVYGTQILVELLADTPVDFLVLCSSRASILGGLGQADYCAANAFLDAFAHYDSVANQRRTVAINWPGWAEVGMRVDTLEQLRIRSTSQPDNQNHTASTRSAETYHPLLEHLAEDSESRQVYQTELRVDKHWILDDHRIVRKAVLPGVAYVEIGLAAAARHANGQPIELRDVYFLAACSVRDDETRPIRCEVERTGDQIEYHVFDGLAARNGEKDQEFAFGTAKILPPEPDVQHDIDAFIERCNQRTIIATDQPLTHDDLGPRWQNVKRIYIGENEMLAELELDEEYLDDLDLYHLHPAILDRTNGAAKIYLAGEGLFMPMSYRRITFKKRLPKRVFAYHTFSPEDDPTRETINFDVVLMDESGVELAVIERFSQKKVNVVATPIKQAFARPAKAATSAFEESTISASSNGDSFAANSSSDVPQTTASAADEGMTSAEGIEAFRRILTYPSSPQVIVSPRNLNASIEQANRNQPLQISDEIVDTAPKSTHPRPDVATEFVAPRNELERQVAEIWQTTMGIESVGAEDNFFELGGDSVVGIQMLARFSKAGFRLTPQQLFQYQTVASLAEVLGSKETASTAGQTANPAAEKARLEEEVNYWLDRQWATASRWPSLPTNGKPVEQNGPANLAQHDWQLDNEHARTLIASASASDRLCLEDILLAGFVESLNSVSDLENFAVLLSFDSDATVNDEQPRHFAYPALLSWRESDSPGDSVKLIKEQLRRIPNEGRGYGTLRERVEDATRQKLQAIREPSIQFRVAPTLERLGEMDEQPDVTRPRAIEFDMVVTEEGVTTRLRYDACKLEPDFAERFERAMVVAIKTLAHYFESESDTMHTPSDFKLAGVDQQQLDRILSSFGEGQS